MMKKRLACLVSALAITGAPVTGANEAEQARFEGRVVVERLDEGFVPSVRAVEDEIREHETGGTDATESPEEGTAPEARRRLRPPGLVELEELLGDRLDTRVKISMGASRGKVVVEFSTLEDLERIYRLVTEPAPSA
jgi:ParB family chromosome partitioning protein